MGAEILIINCATLGEKAKLARISRRLRQIDIASQTGLQVADITNLEKNRLHIIPPWKLEIILRALGLLEDGDGA